MRSFEFISPQRIIFGAGALNELAGEASAIGTHPIVITGSGSVFIDILTRSNLMDEFESNVFIVDREPDLELIKNGIAACKQKSVDILIAIGGGSVIDTAKAISGLAAASEPIEDYFEVIGSGRSIKSIAYPMIAVPTTAGTGAEVTRNAVITIPERSIKVSLRSSLLFPGLAIVDPALATGLPRRETADTGMDALTQLIEPIFSKKRNKMIDALCVDGIRVGSASIEKVYQDGNDIEMRSGMAYASLLSGMALTNAGLGAVHGFAAPIGAMTHAPHGAICAALLPHVLLVNERAIKQRDPHDEILNRFHHLTEWLTGMSGEFSIALSWLLQLSERIGIRTLSQLGISRSDYGRIITGAVASSSMKSNPVLLDEDELLEIIERAY